jgi:hypothetical protein
MQLNCIFSSATVKKQCFKNLGSAICFPHFCHYIPSTNECFTVTILFLKDVLLTKHSSKRFSPGCLSLLPKFTSHPFDFLHASPSNNASYCILSLQKYFSNTNCFNCTYVKKCLLLQLSLASILSYSTNNNIIYPCPIHIHTKNMSEWGPGTVFMVHRTF